MNETTIPPFTRRAVLAGGAALAMIPPAAPLATVPAGVLVPHAVTEAEKELDALFRPATPDPSLEEVRRLIALHMDVLSEGPLPDFAVAFRALKSTAASGDEAAIRFLIGIVKGMFSEITLTIDRIERDLDEACGA